MKTFNFTSYSALISLSGPVVNDHVKKFKSLSGSCVSKRSAKLHAYKLFGQGFLLFNDFHTQHKLISYSTPEYIITGCKITTSSSIRIGMHGLPAIFSNKRCGATSSPKPKRYTANDTTANHWLNSLFSCISPVKGEIEGDKLHFPRSLSSLSLASNPYNSSAA